MESLWQLVELAPVELWDHFQDSYQTSVEAATATLTACHLTLEDDHPARDIYYWLVEAPPDPRSNHLWPVVAQRYGLRRDDVITQGELLTLPTITLAPSVNNVDPWPTSLTGWELAQAVEVEFKLENVGPLIRRLNHQRWSQQTSRERWKQLTMLLGGDIDPETDLESDTSDTLSDVDCD